MKRYRISFKQPAFDTGLIAVFGRFPSAHAAAAWAKSAVMAWRVDKTFVEFLVTEDKDATHA